MMRGICAGTIRSERRALPAAVGESGNYREILGALTRHPAGRYNSSVPAAIPSAPVSATVITVSDASAAGRRPDTSGPAVSARLRSLGYNVIAQHIVPDEIDPLVDALRQATATSRLVVTTGGTGIAPRDITPEATLIVCSRVLDGLSELMRRDGLRQTPFAPLSRAVCGVAGHALILNLPGNPSGAVASLDIVAPLLPHALDLLAGITAHPDHDAT
jgi:molybdenum cofactor synthesis domain-containing protein